MTVIDFQIDALRRCMAELNYEKKELNRRMNTNRQKAAECRKSLRRLEEERRKEHERAQGDADVQPGSAVG